MQEKQSEGHTGWALRGETAVSASPSRSRERPARSPRSISSLNICQSSKWGKGKDMKRPHDYSSPDSDTDEFIDVGQEDSFWWASANHTWGWNTCLTLTLAIHKIANKLKQQEKNCTFQVSEVDVVYKAIIEKWVILTLQGFLHSAHLLDKCI